MKKNVFFTSLVGALFSFYSCSETNMDSSQDLDNIQSKLALSKVSNEEKYSFSVLQFNIWQEGTQVSGGYDAIVNEIAAREPDFVTLSEVRNYNNTSFDERIVASLKAKGKIYYASKGYDNGVLSKYPIKEYSKFSGDTYHRLIAEIRPGQEIAVYSGHLDYTHYALYYPRGYDPITSKQLSAPVTDLGKITQMNNQSQRPQQIKDFIERTKEDIETGRIVILGGDFNEASHLDWTEAVKDKYDHNGVVMPWSSTLSLDKAGFKDSYRIMYPNEVDYPGFTWVAQSPWAPKADERDRIDYIFYYDNGKITVDDSYIVGPKTTIVKNVSTLETSKDKFSLPKGVWPTDHKAVWSTFSVQGKKMASKITLDKISYKLGETIKVNFNDGSLDSKAWIGIYKEGQIPGPSYSSKWQYTGGVVNGSLNFNLSNDSGTYYAAFFKDNGYTEIATRVYFTYKN